MPPTGKKFISTEANRHLRTVKCLLLIRGQSFRLRNRFANHQQFCHLQGSLFIKLHKRRQDDKTKINEGKAFKNSTPPKYTFNGTLSKR